MLRKNELFIFWEGIKSSLMTWNLLLRIYVIYFWNYEELIKEGVNDGLIDPNYENMFNFERNLFKPVNIFGKNPLLFL